MIALTETWFTHDRIYLERVKGVYNILRTDRNTTETKKETGGGCALLVRKDLQIVKLKIANKKFETVWVKISLGKSKIIVGLHYIPQFILPQEFSDYTEQILENFLKTQEKILIIGDFNIPGVNWNNRSINVENYYIKQKGLKLLELAAILRCSQHNTSYDKDDETKVLDLVLTNIGECELDTNIDSLVKQDIYHPPFVFTIKDSPSVESVIMLQKPIYKFSCCNFLLLYNELNRMFSEFDMESNKLDVIQEFYNILYQGIDCTTPKITEIMSKRTGPPWVTKVLRRLINRKRKCYNSFKKTGKLKWLLEFKQLRRDITKLYRCEEQKYLTTLEKSIYTNSHYFWSQINNNKKKEKISLVENGSVITNNTDIANSFKHLFAGKYMCDNSYSRTQEEGTTLGPIAIPTITIKDILDGLNKIKPRVTPGPDQIPAYMMKACKDIIAPILHVIFNVSLMKGVFPEVWKEAYIIPIYKNGAKTDANNYRPVTILNCLSKVFEQIIQRYLAFHVKSRLHKAQHGFVQGKSIETNLIEVTDVILNEINKKNQVDVIYIDLSAAFDSVDHNILLQKLLNIGLSPLFVEWFKSYLTNRCFKVKVNHTLSDIAYMYRGVPQGSSLGPLLFAIFINDLPSLFENIGVNILLYADDIKLYKVIKSFDDSILLQNGLDVISNWVSRNNMKINKSKTKCISFTRKTQYIVTRYHLEGTMIEKTENIRDLGVYYDSKVIFDIHINNMIDSARRIFGYIISNWKKWNKPDVIIYLYKSLIRPKLEYASIIWSSASTCYLKLIEGVQRKLVSFIYHHFKMYNLFYDYEYLCEKLKLELLDKRRSDNHVKFIKSVLEGQMSCEYVLNRVLFKVPTYSTRNHKLLHTIAAKNSPVQRVITHYNLVNSTNQ